MSSPDNSPITALGQMRVCPCCGSPVEERVYVDLNSNTIQIGNEHYKAAAKEAELMKMLVDAWPAPVSYTELTLGIWGPTDDKDRDDALKVYVSRMRKTLAKGGLSIVTVHGRGYRIAPDNAYVEALFDKHKGRRKRNELVAVAPPALPTPINVEREFFLETFVRTVREYVAARDARSGELKCQLMLDRLKIALSLLKEGQSK